MFDRRKCHEGEDMKTVFEHALNGRINFFYVQKIQTQHAETLTLKLLFCEAALKPSVEYAIELS